MDLKKINENKIKHERYIEVIIAFKIFMSIINFKIIMYKGDIIMNHPLHI